MALLNLTICSSRHGRCGSDKHRIGFHYRTGIKTSKCFNCEALGHESRDCLAPCGICGSTQHKSGYHLNDYLYVGKADPVPTDRKPVTEAKIEARPAAKAVATAASVSKAPASRGGGGPRGRPKGGV